MFIRKCPSQSYSLLQNLWRSRTILWNLCQTTHSTKNIQRTSSMWRNTRLPSPCTYIQVSCYLYFWNIFKLSCSFILRMFSEMSISPKKKLILIPQQENKMSKKNEVKKTRNTTHIMKFHFYMFNLILSLNSLLEFKYAKNKIKAI